MEPNIGAAAVDRSCLLQLAGRFAARIALCIELLVASDLDIELVGERIDDREADAAETAGGLVELAAELAAGMKRGEDHLQRRFVLELGMGIDGYAAPVIAHSDDAVLIQLQLYAGRLARHRFVHGV